MNFEWAKSFFCCCNNLNDSNCFQHEHFLVHKKAKSRNPKFIFWVFNFLSWTFPRSKQKYSNNFPQKKKEKLFLLWLLFKKHKIWKNVKLCLFSNDEYYLRTWNASTMYFIIVIAITVQVNGVEKLNVKTSYNAKQRWLTKMFLR